jgi:lipoprotein-anchoring transpeptidase ErfK/SrfK
VAEAIPLDPTADYRVIIAYPVTLTNDETTWVSIARVVKGDVNFDVLEATFRTAILEGRVVFQTKRRYEVKAIGVGVLQTVLEGDGSPQTEIM